MAVTLTHTARCNDPRDRCDWSATGPDADRQAEQHTRRTRHSTVTCSQPIETAATPEPIERTRP